MSVHLLNNLGDGRGLHFHHRLPLLPVRVDRAIGYEVNDVVSENTPRERRLLDDRLGVVVELVDGLNEGDSHRLDDLPAEKHLGEVAHVSGHASLGWLQELSHRPNGLELVNLYLIDRILGPRCNLLLKVVLVQNKNVQVVKLSVVDDRLHDFPVLFLPIDGNQLVGFFLGWFVLLLFLRGLVEVGVLLDGGHVGVDDFDVFNCVDSMIGVDCLSGVVVSWIEHYFLLPLDVDYLGWENYVFWSSANILEFIGLFMLTRVLKRRHQHIQIVLVY